MVKYRGERSDVKGATSNGPAALFRGGGLDQAAFYSYVYPPSAGFRAGAVRPTEAYFSETLGEFVLPYDAVRTAADPDTALLDFLQSTYEAVADSGGWNRAALDCQPGRPGVPRLVP